ncbi:ciliary microtubule inner protein 2B [Gadus morhua]|uniref:Ciliary microtubule inner protein 2B n=2 Tax=Gadus TaxID=8048 RepID=A0A8C4ZNP2_GADMO|nr:protein FAM166B [Gadus morhua]XP_056445120.1 protein FAM166B isoform X1 [Gadus chalcogrammus]
MDRPQFPPKFSKVLMTPDPQYIPGYAGYCPQLKYNMGQTYGQLTHKLLTSPEVRRSSRLVLSTGYPQTADRLDWTTDRPDLIADRPDRTSDRLERNIYGPDWSTERPEQTGHETLLTTRLHRGEDRNLDNMIPGYTGFIPKRQKYFAQTYSQTCRGALKEFTRDQNTRLHSQSSNLPVHYRSPEFQGKKLYTPLAAVCDELPPPHAQKAWKPLGSPYLMHDQSPHKYFISGFTGYVPQSRFLIGRGYPATTNEALIQFGREMRSEPSSYADMRRKSSTLPPIPTVYPSSDGLLPFYDGHVPGYKFTYGNTFGKLTHNALGISDVKRSIGVRS